MPFQKGNQLQRTGRGNTGKRFLTQQLISELNEIDPSEGVEKFRVLVRRLVQRAIRQENADFAAMSYIFDRVEGRAMQAIEMTNTERSSAEPISVEMPLSELARLYAQTLGSPEAGFEPEIEDDMTNVVQLTPRDENNEDDPGSAA